MKNKAIIFFFCLLAIGCTKKSNTNVVLNGKLTDCPTNSTCTYNYYDNADFKDWSKPVHGNFRVFWYKSVNNTLCDAANEIYFKTPVSDGDFDITSSQIASGQVSGYVFSCACCDVVGNVKTLGGEIKGKRSDATHWLINASVIIGTDSYGPIDTIVVNQYFTQQLVE